MVRKQEGIPPKCRMLYGSYRNGSKGSISSGADVLYTAFAPAVVPVYCEATQGDSILMISHDFSPNDARSLRSYGAYGGGHHAGHPYTRQRRDVAVLLYTGITTASSHDLDAQ